MDRPGLHQNIDDNGVIPPQPVPHDNNYVGVVNIGANPPMVYRDDHAINRGKINRLRLHMLNR